MQQIFEITIKINSEIPKTEKIDKIDSIIFKHLEAIKYLTELKLSIEQDRKMKK